jgi:hypothetical protein
MAISDLSHGSGFAGAATAVSYDGRYIVGSGDFGNGVSPEGYRLDTLTGNLTDIGTLTGNSYEYSTPTGVDATGTVVVGNSRSSRNDEAFLWIRGKGIFSLHDYLLSNFAPYLPPNFTADTLITGAAISPDSKTIIGWGSQGSGGPEVFVLVNPRGFAGAPEPASGRLLSLAGIGALCLFARRRWHT